MKKCFVFGTIDGVLKEVALRRWQLAVKLVARLSVIALGLISPSGRVPHDGRIKRRLSKNRAILSGSALALLVRREVVTRSSTVQRDAGYRGWGMSPLQRDLYPIPAKPQGMTCNRPT